MYIAIILYISGFSIEIAQSNSPFLDKEVCQELAYKEASKLQDDGGRILFVNCEYFSINGEEA